MIGRKVQEWTQDDMTLTLRRTPDRYKLTAHFADTKVATTHLHATKQDALEQVEELLALGVEA